MSDVDPTPDDLLVSAVLDGEASPEEAERVASDPRLATRLEQLRLVARAVGGPVPLVDPLVRERHLAAALAEARRLAPPDAGTPGADAPPLAAAAAAPVAPAPPPTPPPPVPPAPPPPPIDLAAVRARRRPVGTVILSVAAALVLVALVAAGLARVASDSGSGGDEAASTAATTGAEAADTAGGTSADAAVPEAQGDDASTLGDGGQDHAPASTVPGATSSASSEREIDPALPSLGTFTKAGDLAASVRGRLVLEPRPEPAGVDPICQDDFPVPTTLLGRATVDGEEGLVYVESAPGSGRRLWLVDPSAAGSRDEACRRVVPVQQL